MSNPDHSLATRVVAPVLSALVAEAKPPRPRSRPGPKPSTTPNHPEGRGTVPSLPGARPGGADSKELKRAFDGIHDAADQAIWEGGGRQGNWKKVFIDVLDPDALRVTVARVPFGANCLADCWTIDAAAKAFFDEWVGRNRALTLDLYCAVLDETLSYPYNPGNSPPHPFRLNLCQNFGQSPFYKLVLLHRQARRSAAIRRAYQRVRERGDVLDFPEDVG